MDSTPTLSTEQRTAIQQRIQPFLKEFILKSWDPKRVVAWCSDHEERATIAASKAAAAKAKKANTITLLTRMS